MAREESVATKDLGIAVIGSGRIGTLRARLAAKHPAVRFVALRGGRLHRLDFLGNPGLDEFESACTHV